MNPTRNITAGHCLRRGVALGWTLWLHGQLFLLLLAPPAPRPPRIRPAPPDQGLRVRIIARPQHTPRQHRRIAQKHHSATRHASSPSHQTPALAAEAVPELHSHTAVPSRRPALNLSLPPPGASAPTHRPDERKPLAAALRSIAPRSHPRLPGMAATPLAGRLHVHAHRWLKQTLEQAGQFMNCSKVFMREMDVGRHNTAHLQQAWQQMGCSGPPLERANDGTEALRH